MLDLTPKKVRTTVFDPKRKSPELKIGRSKRSTRVQAVHLKQGVLLALVWRNT